MYKNKYSKTFEADINFGWYAEVITAIYQYAMDSNTFFAKALERDLIRPFQIPTIGWGYAYGVARVFTWRAENDLGDIAKAYYRATFPDLPSGETLVESVKKFTDGYPENTLICILFTFCY